MNGRQEDTGSFSIPGAPLTPATEKRVGRFLSRISMRIMAFNILLIFLPIAGILFLGRYEKHLVRTLQSAMADEARLVAAALSDRPISSPELQRVVRDFERMDDTPPDARIRIVDLSGKVVADSGSFSTPSPPKGHTRASAIRRNWLYRLGAFLLKKPLQLFRPPATDLETVDPFERAPVLTGAEVRAALNGEVSSTKRISSFAQRSVTLYTAAPIRNKGKIVGAAVVSQTTFRILLDLYAIRLGILQIFAVSIVVGIIISLWVATTIVQPLRNLRLEARAILDRRGRLKGRFTASKKLDEIGDLSRALERLTRRLENHLVFLESFAADVSHEFKNPLASIRTATQMLSEVEEPHQRRRFLHMVEQDIARMEMLLRGLREITLLDSGMSKEERSAVRVDELLDQIVDGFRLRERGRVALELNKADAPSFIVYASPDRLSQVFENLLENALSFSPDATIVRVDLTADSESVIVAISDQGAGIPPENLSMIFDRFFSYRPGQKQGTHTGLGLSIVQAIVEGFNGSVRGSNNQEGGATFEVRLPHYRPVA